jgi:hypothetical protein
MNITSGFKFLSRVAMVAALLVMTAFSAAAQPQPQQLTPEKLAGTYKGTAKMPSGQMEVGLELKVADGKFSGRARSTDAEYQITSGEIKDNKLILKFSAAPDTALLTLQQKGELLVGDWSLGAQQGTVELKKIDPNAKTEPAAKDEISGEWDAIADAQGQPFPFTLTLKLEGEKISGTSASQLGNSNISSGSWKDGKLALVLEGGSGQIALAATMIEGKLSGEYDFAGQLQGKWVAIRKK